MQGDEHYAVGLWVNNWPAGEVAVELVRIIIQDLDVWQVVIHSKLFRAIWISARWLKSFMSLLALSTTGIPEPKSAEGFPRQRRRRNQADV